MTVKLANVGLFKIKLFWNKGYDVIVSAYHVTNKTLSRESNYVVGVVMWPKFGISSISVREVVITSFLYGFHQEKRLFWGVLLDQAQ